jgi:predicted methyltransferase
VNPKLPLTRLVHELLATALQPGDLAVDATAGNGHDTLHLAQRVSPGGRVYAFDVQHRALDATAGKLYAAGLRDSVCLCRTGHQNLLRRVPGEWHGQVAAITFNLGYLPGGDKQITTAAASTLEALEQALQLLKNGGVLSVLAYRGHPGGQQEADAVQRWLEAHADQLACQVHESPGPVLYYCTRYRPAR